MCRWTDTDWFQRERETHHWEVKSTKSGENWSAGSWGDGSSTTCFSCWNGVPHESYGKRRMASSIWEREREESLLVHPFTVLFMFLLCFYFLVSSTVLFCFYSFHSLTPAHVSIPPALWPCSSGSSVTAVGSSAFVLVWFCIYKPLLLKLLSSFKFDYWYVWNQSLWSASVSSSFSSQPEQLHLCSFLLFPHQTDLNLQL